MDDLEVKNGETEETYQYDAFISYRRIEAAKSANLLRHCLVDYHAPKGFPQRPLKVYLDRIYEHATDDFFERTIKPALTSSKALIVIQTPDAAAIHEDGSENWAAREIRYFRSLPQGDNVWIALAKGDFSDPLPADLEKEKPNVERVDVRSLSSVWPRLSEHELLKFIGPLLGVPGNRMPDLRRESERRARSRVNRWIAASITIIAMLATLAVSALMSYQQATKQRRLAEQRLAESVSNNRL